MIGVDWGTSSFRAFRLDAAGNIVDRVEAPRGIMTVAPGGFAQVLAGQVGAWFAAGERLVLMAGMVGSRQGWVEAPYLPCPAGPADLAAALVTVAFDAARVLLVPGLSDADAAGVPEVMRGEETQIFGAMPVDGLVCLPGSHAKWVRVAAGRIDGYTTYLSGEAFAAIRAGTILGRMMPEAAHAEGDFLRGVRRSGEAGHLLHHLFGVRTLGLSGKLADTGSASYLSGLLIGHEVRAAMPPGAEVRLIGAAALCDMYARAIAEIGGTATIEDADAAARGLALLGRTAKWN